MPDLEGEERCEDEVQERQVEGNGRRKEQDRQEDEGADGESPQVVLRQRPQDCRGAKRPPQERAKASDEEAEATA